MIWILTTHFVCGHCLQEKKRDTFHWCKNSLHYRSCYYEQSCQLRSKRICLQALLDWMGAMQEHPCALGHHLFIAARLTQEDSPKACAPSLLFVQVAFCIGFSTETFFVVPFEHGPVKTQNSRALTSSWLYVHLVRLCKLWHVDVNLSHICRWLYQSVISFQNKFEQKKTLPTVCKPTRPASFQICLFTWALAVLLRLS